MRDNNKLKIPLGNTNAKFNIPIMDTFGGIIYRYIYNLITVKPHLIHFIQKLNM